MRVVNLTKYEINLPIKHLTDVMPGTISKNVVMTRELVKSYMVPLANIHQEKVVFLVTDEEKLKFNDIFSVFQLINLRDYTDLIEYTLGDDIPAGASVVTDPYYINPLTGKVENKEFILLPNTVVADAKPGWETVDKPGYSQGTVRFFILSFDEYNALQNKLDEALYFISDRRVVFRGNVPYSATESISDLKEVLLTALADLGMTDTTIPTSKAVVDYINHRFDVMISGVEYRGLIDANNPSLNEYWINALHGYMFRVSIAGIIDGVELGVGDTVIINKDVTGTPTKADMDIIPYTLDEIGDLRNLKTESKENLVSAINEVYDSLSVWDGISK